MSDEEQQVAIAEACGWEYLPGDEPTYGGNYKQAIWYHPDKGSHKTDWRKKGTYGLPDYLNNLNAMHEAENIIPPGMKRFDYNAKLFLIASGANLASAVNRPDCIYAALTATACQRAEALLKTIGKWKAN